MIRWKRSEIGNTSLVVNVKEASCRHLEVDPSVNLQTKVMALDEHLLMIERLDSFG